MKNVLDLIVLDPLQDGKSRLQLIDYMGGDLAVVNDARASFDKASTSFTDRDAKLIDYLISHQHYSPLRSTVFKFQVKAPIMICRQWWKHCLASNHNDEQISWNEKSFRYVTMEDVNEFYIPREFRQQSKSNKQCSGDVLDNRDNAIALTEYEDACKRSFESYQTLINLGVSREQARGVLAPSVYSSWVWTVSLQSLLNFIHLRKGEGAQSEIQLYAQSIEDLIRPIVPRCLEVYK